MIIKKKTTKINSVNSNEKNKKLMKKTISLTKDEDNNKKSGIKKIEQI